MNTLNLGQGLVYHSRHEGADNRFRYPTLFVYFDCAQEADLERTFRSQHHGFFSLKAPDYLDQKKGLLIDNVRRFLKERCNYQADTVWFHTMPRMFGYAFNPVSFWICRKNNRMDAILVEVHNTFGERHFYWLQPPAGIENEVWYETTKAFHVSPFFPVNGFYRFRFDFRDDRVRIDINHHAPDRNLRLATWVEGRLSPIGEARFFSLLLKYGWITPLVVMRIHFQAVKLFFKKMKFYKKPAPPTQEVT